MPPMPAVEKPLLRGVLHQAAFAVSLVVGTLLVVGAEGGRHRLAAAVFAGSAAACFGASALYHRVTWTPHMRLWMRRAGHGGGLPFIPRAPSPPAPPPVPCARASVALAAGLGGSVCPGRVQSALGRSAHPA